ncbi:hypothetical protein ACFWUZ_33645 [Streptomyces sp. NPDC058646]|uniref:hypothetical protein n=1 Tax=Streptomyces sp. NPDC058646 TaxID=3346574 RepID=UPI003661E680
MPEHVAAGTADVDAAAGVLPDAVLDGELVAVLNDGSGVAFDRLQSRDPGGPAFIVAPEAFIAFVRSL